MSKAGINRNLSNNAFNAAEQANNPGGTNVYATLADLFQQDGLIDGSAVWSGSGFTYDVTNLLYRIGGVLYTSTATQVTLTAADLTNDRKDLIIANTAGVVSVKTGVAAPAPVAPALDVDEVLVAEVFVGAGTTAPVITIEALYDENAGSPTEWVGTSDDLNVTFASVADPNTGTVSIETTTPLGSNKYIQLAKGSPYTITSGTFQFYIKAKQAMSTPSGQLNIGFYVAGSLVGNSVYIGGSPTNIYGFDPTDTSAYQLVSIPITAFGVLPTTVDAIRFFKGPGSTTAEFFLDNVEIQEGAVAPPVAPSLPSLTELSDWVGDSSNTAVERKSSIQVFPGGSAPDATFDETQGYRIGSIVYDKTDIVNGNKVWICFDASTGAAVWKLVNNEVLNYWNQFSSPADSGFTWGNLGILPGNGSHLKFVEGAGMTIETDPTQQAIRFTATGGSAGTADSSGVLTGGVLSVGTGGPGVATTFSISDGTGQIVDATGAKTPVSWSGLTDQALTFLATNLISFIAIDSGGSVIQSATKFTAQQARQYIVLGVVVHVNFTTVDTVNNEQKIAYNVMSSVYDGFESLGFFNVSGNVFSANGANMNINKSVGVMFKMGSNYDTDINNPHKRTLAALTPAQFQYRFSDGTSGILTETNIDPNNLDDGAGGLTAVATNRWSVQRIYCFTSNNVKIQRGVAEYTTSEAAIAGISTEAYVTEPSIAANGLFRGWLIVKQGATALNGADAIFLSAGKLGEQGASGGGAGTGATDLQTAYDNSTANPEILTNATNGAHTVRRGSAADTDNIYEGQNGAGTTTFGVTGEGKVSALQYNGVALTTGGLATQYLDAQGNYSVPAGGGGSAKFNRSFYAYNMTPAGGYSWNGLTVGATTLTTLAERHRLHTFAGVGQPDGVFVNVTLPNSYVAGTNIRVTLKLTANVSGDTFWGVGVTQLSALGAYSNDADTQYVTNTVTMLAAFQDNTSVFVFSGTGMNPGDPLAILVYRDPGNVADVNANDTYLHQILIEEI